MSLEPTVESALQVITRLIPRPSVEDLYKDIFFNKLENSDIIEIRGTLNSRIHEFLTRLIVKSILPLSCNGLDMDVLLIDTVNHFTINHVFKVLRDEICDHHGPTNVDELVKKLLTNLKVVKCYTYHQLLLTLNSLDNMLLKHKRVGLIIIDNISSFYWEFKLDLSYNSYLMKLLNIIKNITGDFRVLTMYIKQFNFVSKRQTLEWQEGRKILRYEICLSVDEKSCDLVCKVKSGNEERQFSYKINERGVDWTKCTNITTKTN